MSLNFTSLTLRPGLDNLELYQSATVDLQSRFWQATEDPTAAVAVSGTGRRLTSSANVDTPGVVTSGRTREGDIGALVCFTVAAVTCSDSGNSALLAVMHLRRSQAPTF